MDGETILTEVRLLPAFIWISQRFSITENLSYLPCLSAFLSQKVSLYQLDTKGVAMSYARGGSCSRDISADEDKSSTLFRGLGERTLFKYEGPFERIGDALPEAGSRREIAVNCPGWIKKSIDPTRSSQSQHFCRQGVWLRSLPFSD